MPGNAGGGKEPWFESDAERGKGVTTGGSLAGSEKVRKLQTVLHAKAKEEPDRRFHALIDKVWREDFLAEAWRRVRRNGGAPGMDGETFADIESYGVERWLGELARDLKDGTYTPKPVRQVLIPKKQPGKFRPLGIPCIRDRVAQTSALLVLEPIFEADLQPEQYAYRPGRSAHDAVNRVHRLLNGGHHEVVDCDLSNYFGEIPHVELIKSVARRVSDGRMLGLIKAWLKMPVEEDDGKGGRRRTNRARRERKGTPQGSPISPLVSNLYMRRFILGWKVLGHTQHFRAEIVNYADDLCVLGKAPSAEMLTAVERLMAGLKLPVNERKTRCLRCPDEAFEFLGYRIGRNYRPTGERGLYRHPAQQGERPEHLPQDQRNDCTTVRAAVVRGHGGTSEPNCNRVGELLQPWAGQPGLQRGQPTRGPAAAQVALPETQGEIREIRALLGHEAARRLRPRSPVATGYGLSECEGMISSESRMRENRTSSLMRGGLETRLREPDCGPKRKRRTSHRTLKLACQPPTLPASPPTPPRRNRGPCRGAPGRHS